MFRRINWVSLRRKNRVYEGDVIRWSWEPFLSARIHATNILDYYAGDVIPSTETMAPGGLLSGTAAIVTSGF